MTAGGPPAVTVGRSDIHGRGVFAMRRIEAGELIERCPVLRLPAAQRDALARTLLEEYYFDWDGDAGVALGYGSLYNHGDPPNAQYRKLLASGLLEVVALVAIEAGQEITFDYSGTAADA
jgi:SET domain-containing protein